MSAGARTVRPDLGEFGELEVLFEHAPLPELE
jgi:hypothetical protein